MIYITNLQRKNISQMGEKIAPTQTYTYIHQQNKTKFMSLNMRPFQNGSHILVV